jgi:uncharacterized Zn finger protein
MERCGDTLLAEVEGSDYDPYEVVVKLDAGGVVNASCSCPYDWGGSCKHIVAALLAYIHQPEQVTERPPTTDLLSNLDREALVTLLINLLEAHPQLADWVEAQVALAEVQPQEQQTEEPGPRQRHTPLDPQAFRRQVRSILRGAGRMDPYGVANVAASLSNIVGQADPFLEAGDGRNALVILEVVADEYLPDWIEYDYEGESTWLFADLGSAFAEAILSADLSKAERDAWAERLSGWQQAIDDYGFDEGFDAAIAAARLGWDYPPLQRAMQGHVSEQGAWEGEVPWYADALAVARLNVLERQERFDEYLNLAQAEGQTTLYITMLVKVGRADEAVTYALEYLSTTDEALALAQALRQHDHPQDALRVAEHGLSLHGNVKPLAHWLRDLASGLGERELALMAARTAYFSSPSLEDYQAVQSLADAAWPPNKDDLLEHLASTSYAPTKVAIYLHEGMVEQAIQAVDREPYASYSTVELVVDTAWQSHPNWVIRQCKRQAEPIMDGGKSRQYHHAVRWLAKARQAYLAADRADEWSTYLEGLISKHYRKYSLRPQLEGLRT